MLRTLLLAVAFAATLPTASRAQFKDDNAPKEAPTKDAAQPDGKTRLTTDKPTAGAYGIKLDKEFVQRVRFGVVVTAGGGGAAAVYGTIPVPIDWPEQSVKIVDEEVAKGASKVQYRTVDGTAKQMQVSIPRIKPGETAKVLITVEVKRRAILPPDDTSGFTIPTKPDAALKRYLVPSPKIESTDKRIVAEAKAIAGAHDDAWKKVEALYDWVRERVEYRNGPLRGALAAYKDRWGDCEDMSSLFIAMCRAIGVPARTVWVPGHCYPEFYLVDRDGKGHWFPCQAAGSRAFGGIPELRPILQKGDNFRDADRPKERLRYLSEHFTCKIEKGDPPRVKFIREDVATEQPLGENQDPDAGKLKE